MNWDGISRTARLKVVQLTILVPILGYLILFSEWFIQNFTVFGQFPTWKIYALYYGFTILAIASILYNWKCPRLIKTYSSATEYISSEERIMNNTKTIELLQNIYLLTRIINIRTESRFTGTVTRFFNDLDREVSSNLDVRGAIIKILRGTLKLKTLEEFMFAYFELLVETHATVRKFVYWMFKFGFIIIAIPSIAMFIEVLIRSIRAVYG
tara:strand:+ start:13864 stop:14496 length:633 start_codon:yes stop_codon:yes gene_type:complete